MKIKKEEEKAVANEDSEELFYLLEVSKDFIEWIEKINAAKGIADSLRRDGIGTEETEKLQEVARELKTLNAAVSDLFGSIYALMIYPEGHSDQQGC